MLLKGAMVTSHMKLLKQVVKLNTKVHTKFIRKVRKKSQIQEVITEEDLGWQG